MSKSGLNFGITMRKKKVFELFHVYTTYPVFVLVRMGKKIAS